MNINVEKEFTHVQKKKLLRYCVLGSEFWEGNGRLVKLWAKKNRNKTYPL